MAQLGFYFDSSACSGCKACQAACKDKNNLPTGILWRRVYEVTGGGWTRRGRAWSSDVFSYNISLACNHCRNPICVEVCPSSAIVKRPDGIVLIQSDRCLGCRYCSWACPYDAPQYDAGAGRMGKCNSCADNVDAGRSPACVAGCPMRAMDFGDLIALEPKYGRGHDVYPLPESDLTHPATIVKPHREAKRASTGSARIANREEVHSRGGMTEGPLIGFTLLAQMAVGVSLVLSAFNHSASAAVISLALCIVMGIALALSLFHLGTWANAWRAILNLRSSWLSREILFSLLFMGALIFSTGLLWLGESPMTTPKAVGWGTATLGLALVYSMTRVYRLRTVPTWNTWSTTALFFTTSLILGTLGYDTLIVSNANSGQLQAQIQLVNAIAVVLLTTHILIVRLSNQTASAGFILLRLRLLLLSLSLVAVALVAWDGNRLSTGAVIAFMLAFAAEVIGRYTFYQSRRGWPYGI